MGRARDLSGKSQPIHSRRSNRERETSLRLVAWPGRTVALRCDPRVAVRGKLSGTGALPGKPAGGELLRGGAVPAHLRALLARLLSFGL